MKGRATAPVPSLKAGELTTASKSGQRGLRMGQTGPADPIRDNRGGYRAGFGFQCRIFAAGTRYANVGCDLAALRAVGGWFSQL